MLKEYRFNRSYEYYPFKHEKDGTYTYSINDHKIDAGLYYTLLDKVKLSMPLDITTVFFWQNHKTGSYTRSEHRTYNEDTYE